jgi:predicted aspartyl protease
MSKIQHLAFRQENPSLCLQLITEVEIFDASNPQAGIKVKALWDTGASGTVIVPSIAKKLELLPINRIKVAGVNNVSMADVVQVSIELPNKVMVKETPVMVCDLIGEIDLLIGMDIILLGDFSISNCGEKTLFSFAIPPFEDKTDLYDKALSVNKGT